MKDVTMIIESETVDKFFEIFSDSWDDTFTGCLLDNHFFDIGKNNYKIGRKKIRSYVVIREKYLNEWSSCYELYMTDSEKKYRELFDMYYKEREEYEKEETAQEEGGRNESSCNVSYLL